MYGCVGVWLEIPVAGSPWQTQGNAAPLFTSLQLCLISHVRAVWSPTETTDLLTHNHTKCLIMLAPFKDPSAVLSIECSLHYMVTAFTEHISLSIITLSCWFSCWVVKCLHTYTCRFFRLYVLCVKYWNVIKIFIPSALNLTVEYT